MPSITINLSWVDTNRVEDGYRVYKSTSPMDPSVSMPAPVITLDPNAEEYVDTDVVYGQTYYYIVSAFNNLQSLEVFSENKKVVCEENIYAISTNGEFHKIDTDGNRIFVDRTQNLFGSITTGFPMDMDYKGNFYYISDNTLNKVDKNFQNVWSYDMSPYSFYSGYFAFYVGVDECVYCINLRHLNQYGDVKVFKINKDGTEGETIDIINTSTTYNAPGIALSPDMTKLYTEYSYSSTTYAFVYDLLTGYRYSYTESNNENRSYHTQRSICIDKNNNAYSGGFEHIVSYDQYGDLRWNVDNFSYDQSYSCVLDTTDSYVYVLTSNNTRIYKFNTVDGSTTGSAYNNNTNDICIDSNNNVYAVDSNGYIRKYDSDLNSVWSVNTLSASFDYILIEPGMHFQSIHKNLGDE